MNQILVINPGSSSTKVALYSDSQERWNVSLTHPQAELAAYPTIHSQLDMRYDRILSLLTEKNLLLSDLNCIVARGGLLPPGSGGGIIVDPDMLDVLKHHTIIQHASNLGAALAYRMAAPQGLPCFIYDPVTVDEMLPVSRITGLREVARSGRGHNLNMRAVARKFCTDEGLDYLQVNLIVAHLGGGITLSLHSQGRIIDMMSDDEGPFSPERAGLIPTYRLVRLIFERGLDESQTMVKLQHGGGLVSHLGTADAYEAEQAALAGDAQAALVLEAMALNIARSVAALAVSVNGEVDGILLTGGIARSIYVTDMIRARVRFIADVWLYPGELEMEALAAGALRILRGVEEARPFIH